MASLCSRSTYKMLYLERSLTSSFLMRNKSSFKGKKQKQAGKVIYQDLNLPPKNHPDFEEGEFLPRRLTYMPPGLKFGLKKRRYRKIKEWLTLIPPEEEQEEWTQTPEYPPLVNEKTRSSRQHLKRLEWYKHIRSLPTAEQKLFEITDKTRHRSIFLKCWALNYNYLDLYQSLTRTHLIRDNLPLNTKCLDIEKYCEALKDPILNAIACHRFETKRDDIFKYYRPLTVHRDFKPEVLLMNNLLQDINSICQKVLGVHYPHLVEAQVDHVADIRSWWWNHIPPPRLNNYLKLPILPNVDQALQYRGEAPVQLRYREPLPPIVNFSDPMCRDANVPPTIYNPAKNGFVCRWNYLQSIPGFWSLNEDTKYDYPLLAFLPRYPLQLREKMLKKSFDDNNEFLDAMGVMHGFAWLNSIAATHGFTPYDELTYPFVTHLIITDGQFWTFFVYQLNAHSFHSDVDKHERNNICWSSGEMKLYDSYENGEFKGFNNEVLQQLVKLYVQVPHALEETEVRPYLGEDYRTEEEVMKTRKHLRRRFGQAMLLSERRMMAFTRVFPWEWVHLRHSKAPPTVHWRIPPKPRWPKWPVEHFTRFTRSF